MLADLNDESALLRKLAFQLVQALLGLDEAGEVLFVELTDSDGD